MAEEKVGKYVHLTWKGYTEGHDNIQNKAYKEILNTTLYKNYDTDKEAALNFIRSKLTSQNKANELKYSERSQIEDMYMAVMKAASNKESDNYKLDQIHNAIIKYFNEKLQTDYIKGFDKAGKIFITKDIKPEDLKNEYKNIASDLKELEPNNNTVYMIEDFCNKFKNITKFIDKIFSKNKDRRETNIELLKDIKKLKQELIKLYQTEQNIEEKFSSNDTKVIDSYLKNIKKYSFSKEDNKLTENFISNCNNLLAKIRAFFYPAYYEGYLFEYIGQIANIFLQRNVDEISTQEIGKIIKSLSQNKIGQKSEGFELSSTKIEKVWFPAIKNNKNGVQLNFTNSSKAQQKIDITITLPSKNFPASLKSYSFKSGRNKISLVSGTSLLYLMQGSHSSITKTSNQYLNLYSTHKDTNFKPENLQKAQADILNTMLIIIIYQAISGDSYGKINPAQLLVLNNKDANHPIVKVFTVQEVINNYINNIDKTSSSKNKLKNILKQEFKQTKEDWQPSKKKQEIYNHINDRIQRILFQAHERKITAAIDVRYIKGNSKTGTIDNLKLD